MFRKLVFSSTLPFLLFVLFMLSAPRAEAGQYELHVCDGVNPSRAPMSEVWWSGPWSQGARDNCSEGWIVRWDSLNPIPNLSFGVEGGVGAQLVAPAGTSFDYVRADSNVGSQGGGARCTAFFRGNGSLIDGTQNCRGASYSWGYTGWQGRQSSSVGSDRVYMLGFCTYGSCNIGPQGGFQAQIKNIVVRINDTTAPALGNGSGLWSTGRSFVRGSWPVGFSASDGMGVKLNSASLAPAAGENNPQLVESGSQSYCNPAFNGSVFYGASLQPCPGSASLSSSLDTARLPDGQAKLTLASRDATSTLASVERRVNVDNSLPVLQAPAIPDTVSSPVLSLSLSASDQQSGISGFQCELDGAGLSACSQSYTSPALSPGSHTFCFRALNNSFDVDGNPGASSKLCRSFSYVPPAPSVSKPPAPKSPSPASPDVSADADSDEGCLLYGDQQDRSLSFTLKLGKRQVVKGSADASGALSLNRSSSKLRLVLSDGDEKLKLSGRGRLLSAALPEQSADYSLSARFGKQKARTQFTVSADDCQ